MFDAHAVHSAFEALGLGLASFGLVFASYTFVGPALLTLLRFFGKRASALTASFPLFNKQGRADQ